jgi:hypothetical protein
VLTGGDEPSIYTDLTGFAGITWMRKSRSGPSKMESRGRRERRQQNRRKRHSTDNQKLQKHAKNRRPYHTILFFYLARCFAFRRQNQKICI